MRPLWPLALVVNCGAVALPALAAGSRSSSPRVLSVATPPQKLSQVGSLVLAPHIEARHLASRNEDPIQLASVDGVNHSLFIHPEALDALVRAPSPICMLAVAGAGGREGKSTWLNMFSSWLAVRWPRLEGGVPSARSFEVRHELGAARGTQKTGARMLLLSGKDGSPLPGTRCASVALVDTEEAVPRGGLSGGSPATHRLFAFTRLLTSTFVLHLMHPIGNQLAALQSAVQYAHGRMEAGALGGPISHPGHPHSPPPPLPTTRFIMSMIC